MSGINKVILVGHLGKDPEIRTFENGSKKASFSLATTEYRKDKDGNRVEMTEWHNIVCWRNLAENAEKFLVKGTMIYGEGKLRTRSWDDNGAKRYITEIEASTFTMLSSKSDETEQKVANMTAAPMSAPVVPQPPVEENFPPETDDLPF